MLFLLNFNKKMCVCRPKIFYTPLANFFRKVFEKFYKKLLEKFYKKNIEKFYKKFWQYLYVNRNFY